jgi:O-antigen/teichoic acid export membrane protein
MNKSKNSYDQIIKTTSLFGGVQIINLIISMVRSKVLAILIGPLGFGITSLFSSTINLINSITDFGLGISSVKVISVAKNNQDYKKVSTLVTVLKRLVWFTILIGVFLTVTFASFLSNFNFGNDNYTISILLLSIAITFMKLTNTNLAVLQSLRKLKYLAKANLYGNIVGLIISLPLYYFYKLDAIVPVIIIASFVSFIFTSYYSVDVNVKKIKINNKEAFKEGKEMLRLGLTISFSSMLTFLGAYILQVFISFKSGVNQVGLYQAGFLMLNSYVGLIFNAMATDYFPKLSVVSNNIIKIRKIVHQQALIAVLLITPIIIVFLTFAPLIISILYTKDFLPIVSMVSWGVLGMLFRAISWSMGYIIIAKGDSEIFIKTSLGFNILLLALNVLSYVYGGLQGLGVSFFIYYLIHFIIVRTIVKSSYSFYFHKGFYKVFINCFLLCTLTFLFTYLTNILLKYLFLGVMILISIFNTYKILNKKIDFKKLISELLKQKDD